MTDIFDPISAATATDDARVIYSVERLNNEVKDLLEHSYPLIWIEAEISNLSRPASGHWYFSLKDDNAQVRCAMFRNRNQLIRFKPEHGMQVLVRARISLYPARGEFQLIIEHMEEAGAGALQRAFEDLKHKLQQEGLFNPETKKNLPIVPRCIGIITSATGAALQDALSVLRRRYPLGEVIIYPVPVQGDAAPPAIIKALQTAEQRQECDVLLIIRGGGSLEDLWAFNEETVARAIYACDIPTISGVGHEVDFTITDFVADQRAPTPSAAAELVAPDLTEWLSKSRQLVQRLGAVFNQQREQTQQRCHWLERRLQTLHPGKRLEQHMQRMDELEQRLHRSIQSRMHLDMQRFGHQQERLLSASPARRVPELNRNNQQLLQRLGQAVQKQIDLQGNRFRIAAKGLDNLSPLKTLDRGYAITTFGNKLVRDVSELNKGDSVNVRLAKGAIDCEVTQIHTTTDLIGRN